MPSRVASPVAIAAIYEQLKATAEESVTTVTNRELAVTTGYGGKRTRTVELAIKALKEGGRVKVAYHPQTRQRVIKVL